MGSSLKFQMGSGYVRRQIIANSDIFAPIFVKTNRLALNGKPVLINTEDDEAKVKVEATSSQTTATFIYPVDTDEKDLNGRVYFEDRFVFNPKERKLIDVHRTYRMTAGTENFSFWSSLYKDLKGLKDLDVDDRYVQRFFQKVVLDLPQPSELYEEGDEKSSPPPSAPSKPSVAPPVFSINTFRAISSPNNLEEAFARRLICALPTLTGAFGDSPDSTFLVQTGLLDFQKGWGGSNASLEELYQKNLGSSEKRVLAKGLLVLAQGDMRGAANLWMTIRKREPAADFLMKWVEDYQQARDNLRFLTLLKTLVVEGTAKGKASDQAWINQFFSIFSEDSDTGSIDETKALSLLNRVEEKIKTGEAGNIEEAVSQLEIQGDKSDKAILKKIQSGRFAAGAGLDLIRSSSLSPCFQIPALLAIADEKLVPGQFFHTAQNVFSRVALSNDYPEWAAAGKQGLLSLYGEGNFSSQIDWSLRRATDQLTDPLMVASFLTGQTAFSLGESFALTRWGQWGIRSTLLANVVGVTAEAPAFEISQRLLSNAFVGGEAWKDFGPGLARSWLTFGAFRGGGMVSRFGGEYLERNGILPFGRYTIPLYSRFASFGMLHGMNEIERALNLRAPEGFWVSRLLLDGAFYLQAGFSHGLGENLLGREWVQQVREKEFTTEWFGKNQNPLLLPPAKKEGTPSPAPGNDSSEDTPVPSTLTTGEETDSTLVVNSAKPLPPPSQKAEGSDMGTPISFKLPIPNVDQVLKPGDKILATDLNSPDQPRRAEHTFFIPKFGQVSAFTDVGIDKGVIRKPPKRVNPINEDAYGFGLDQNGLPVFVVADGMGGYGNGDAASGRMIQVILDTVASSDVSLGKSFVSAHEAIAEDNKARKKDWIQSGAKGEVPGDAGSVGVAVRVLADGQVEIARVGDATLWILRPQADGAFEVLVPYFPDSYAGFQRSVGNVRDTFGMLTVPQGSRVMSSLGTASDSPDDALRVVEKVDPGKLGQILNTTVKISSNGSSTGTPFRLQSGDLLLLTSDGIGGLFNRQQMGELLKGLTNAEDVRNAIQRESQRRLELYLKFAPYGKSDLGRVQLPDGRFIDAGGAVYNTAKSSDKNPVAHYGPDNIVGLVYQHFPFLDFPMPSSDAALPAAKNSSESSK